MKICISAGVATIACLMVLCATCAAAQPGEKKLLEYGWDVPTPVYVAENIREMEKRPFDGILMRIPSIGRVFHNQKYDEATIQNELDACRAIEWGIFTDNFIIVYAASTMDWFSDEDWDAVLHNVRLNAKAAKLARCVGLCFDHEPYGDNPWRYPSQKHADAKSFDEYQAIARKRGAQFMQAIEAEFSSPVIHTFFQLSYFDALAKELDPQVRDRKLSQAGYGLLPAFLNGMLDVASPGVIITDGNEPSYYYTEPLQYFRAFHSIKQTALALVAPENRVKYRTQMQASQALYVDYLFKYWPHATPATHMTEQERAKWFEHNTYWALYTSDRYVWLYSEKMNWWKNENLPPGLEDAVISARRKIAAREGLGFEMTEIIAHAKQREAEHLQAILGEMTKTVPRLQAGIRPLIDGKPGENAWLGETGLDQFAPYAYAKEGALTAKTFARVAYDDANLYIAVRCEEPRMAERKVVGTNRDDDVWLGDSVDVFLTPEQSRTPFYHIIINPSNVRWDAIHSPDVSLEWNPEYESATSDGPDYWLLELAVPWASLNMDAPQSGEKLHANICRQRSVGEDTEHSSWSRCVRGFVERDRFGEWVME